MTPIVALGVGLGLLAQGAFGSPGGTLKPQPGPWAPAASPRPYTPPVYGAPPAPSYSVPSYTTPRTPTFPEPPKPPTMAQPEPFKPYKGTSVYSNRGGIDAYKKPAKPPGYIDLR